MRIGILANKEGWHYRQLAEAFAGRGIEVENYHITDIVVKVGMSSNSFAAGSFVGDKRLEELDALIVRSIPAGSLEQIVFRMNALHCLEQAGVFVMNPPSVIEKTVDKFYTSSLLEAYGVPTPPTMVTENRGAAMEAFFELGGDVVVKPLFGSLGKGMVRVDNPDVAYRVFSALEMNHYVFYLQKFISHENRDIRAFVLGDRVLSAMERRGANWKTNIAQGAIGYPVKLNDCQERLALEAAKAIGCMYAGVDLVRSEDGEEFVLEVNGVPGWEGLQKVSSVDIAGEIADFVLKGREGC
jgi:RimK family alpha-L-glutamate ligase